MFDHLKHEDAEDNEELETTLVESCDESESFADNGSTSEEQHIESKTRSGKRYNLENSITSYYIDQNPKTVNQAL